MSGLPWVLVLAALLLLYFYAHYAFASITAHSSAMYIPFLAVMMAAGAPPVLCGPAARLPLEPERLPHPLRHDPRARSCSARAT